MGAHRGPAAGRRILKRVARVVPDLPVFAGRRRLRLRGARRDGGAGRHDRAGAAGRAPGAGVRGVDRARATTPVSRRSWPSRAICAVFDDDLLGVLRWAAIHYVAPVAAVLAKAAPPTLPRRVAVPALDASPRVEPPSPRWRRRPRPASTPRPATGWGRAVGPGGGRPGVRRCWRRAAASRWWPPPSSRRTALADELGEVFGNRVVLGASGLGNAALTKAWSRAAIQPGLCWWSAPATWPSGRSPAWRWRWWSTRGGADMKDKATPTLHARDILWRRSAVERFPLVLCGAVPTGEALGARPRIERQGGGPDLWGLVEVVDRRDDPPGRGLIGDTARRAMPATGRQRGQGPGLHRSAGSGHPVRPLPAAAGVPRVRGPARSGPRLPAMRGGARRRAASAAATGSRRWGRGWGS